MNYQDKSLCRVRTVTTFITLPKDKDKKTNGKKKYSMPLHFVSIPLNI